MNRYFSIVCLLIAVAYSPEAWPQTLKVKTKAVNSEVKSDWSRFVGTLKPKFQVSIYAMAPGRVEEVQATVGERVKAGQKLCKIDGQLNEARLKSAKLSRQVASQQFKSAKRSANRGGTSKLKLSQTEQALAATEVGLEEAKKIFEGAFCVAPRAGKLAFIGIDEGDQVPAGKMLVTIIDDSEWSVHGQIAQSQVSRFRAGLPIKVVHSGRQIPGELTGVDLVTDGSGGMVGFEGKLLASDPQFVGQASVPVLIEKLPIPGTLQIESKYVQVRDGKKVVATAIDDKVVLKEVMVVGEGNGVVYLSGLQEGDQLITDAYYRLNDGDVVEVR